MLWNHRRPNIYIFLGGVCVCGSLSRRPISWAPRHGEIAKVRGFEGIFLFASIPSKTEIEGEEPGEFSLGRAVQRIRLNLKTVSQCHWLFKEEFLFTVSICARQSKAITYAFASPSPPPPPPPRLPTPCPEEGENKRINIIYFIMISVYTSKPTQKEAISSS